MGSSPPTGPCAPVIVIAGMKGGVGRSVMASNLAAMIAVSGRRTLLLDLDAKGDATASLGLPRATGAGDLHAIAETGRLLEAARAVKEIEGLFVWPGGPMHEQLEALLWARGWEGRERLLRGALGGARRRYRVILIDAPADFGPLGRNAVVAADVVLLPLLAGRIAANAIDETLAAIDRVRPQDLPPLDVYGVRHGLRPEELLLGEALALPGAGQGHRFLLDATIAYDARALAEATGRGLPVILQAPGSRITRSYLELGREVIAKIVEKPRVFPDDTPSQRILTPAEGTRIEPSGP